MWFEICEGFQCRLSHYNFTSSVCVTLPRKIDVVINIMIMDLHDDNEKCYNLIYLITLVVVVVVWFSRMTLLEFPNFLHFLLLSHSLSVAGLTDCYFREEPIPEDTQQWILSLIEISLIAKNIIIPKSSSSSSMRKNERKNIYKCALYTIIGSLACSCKRVLLRIFNKWRKKISIS